jgi:hypothetical protein
MSIEEEERGGGGRRRRMQITCLRGGRERWGFIICLTAYFLIKTKAHDYLCWLGHTRCDELV